MLDLVKSETERIDSRFLEPACGTGNFLVEILHRKLNVATSTYSKNPAEWEKYAILALTSIYGVELLQDNVDECQARLFAIFNEAYTRICKNDVDEDCRDAARFILERNILCGDALTMLRADGKPIIFSEWSMVQGNFIKRADYRLDDLLSGKPGQDSFWMNDIVKEFPPCDYRKVQHAQ